MTTSLNVRAQRFARRELFLGRPDERYMVISMSARNLADKFCEWERCEDFGSFRPGTGCLLHGRAMVLGLSKLVASAEVTPHLSAKGLMFVRLSPFGVLAPLDWASPPLWLESRPDVLEWAGRIVASLDERTDESNRRRVAARLSAERVRV